MRRRMMNDDDEEEEEEEEDDEEEEEEEERESCRGLQPRHVRVLHHLFGHCRDPEQHLQPDWQLAAHRGDPLQSTQHTARHRRPPVSPHNTEPPPNT